MLHRAFLRQFVSQRHTVKIYGSREATVPTVRPVHGHGRLEAEKSILGSTKAQQINLQKKKIE